MDKLTIKEAAQKWVGEFNAIPQNFIKRAIGEDFEVLITTPCCCDCGETNFDEGACTNCGSPDSEAHNIYDLPMWGTMWTFGSSLDEDWVRERGGLTAMKECGFWVYDDLDLGIFFGINGAGYDFYEQHWIPLYEARGLRWHVMPLNEIIEDPKFK